MAQSVEHVLGKDEVPGPIPGRGFMDKKYVSVDVETSGSTPGKYSMLSLGACIVGDVNKRFYAELKPLNLNFDEAAMRVGCLGLKCLERLTFMDRYNPKSANFKPGLVLELLSQEGRRPDDAMLIFKAWLMSSTEGYKPVIAAAPIIFDGMFISWYFDNFSIENPFGHSGEDINSMYRGAVRNNNTSIKDLGLRSDKELSHNALEDAIQQSIEFEKVLEIMNQR